MRTAEVNRRDAAPPAVARGIRDHVAWLDRQLDRVDRDLADAIAASVPGASAPGYGRRSPVDSTHWESACSRGFRPGLRTAAAPRLKNHGRGLSSSSPVFPHTHTSHSHSLPTHAFFAALNFSATASQLTTLNHAST